MTAASVPRAPRTAVPNALLLLLPPAVLLTGLAAVSLGTARERTPPEQAAALLLALLPLLTAWLMRVRRTAWDRPLLGVASMLCALSVVTVARVAPELLLQQMLWIGLGWAAFVLALLIPNPLRALRRYRYTWLVLGLAFAALSLVMGQDATGTGARIWLRFGPVSIQPSELLRILLVAFLAGYLSERREMLESMWVRFGALRLPPLPYLVPLVAMVGLALAILLFQHDMGPMVLYFGTFLAMVYVATGRHSYVLAGLLLFLLSGYAGYAFSDHIRSRFDLWLDPYQDPQGSGYQSLVAMGGLAFGGVLGRGPGFGYPDLIPAAHTDYPLAVIGEEWGLLGVLAVLLLYMILVTRSLELAARLRDSFSQLLAFGLGASLGIQAFIILGGTLRLIPLSGITAPFLSYGGSSMIMSFIALALITRAWSETTTA